MSGLKAEGYSAALSHPPYTSGYSGWSADSTGQHGLDIVRALATDWGTDGDHAIRTTWARFDWQGDS